VAFTEFSDHTTTALSTLSASRLPPLAPDTRLEVFPQLAPALYSFTGVGALIWDATVGDFIPTSVDPHRDLSLVDTPRLRLSRENGAFLKRVQLDLPAGGTFWALFDLVNGRFPFDVVESASVFEGSLYLGGQVGLQIYAPGQGFALSSASEWIYPSMSAGAGLLPVSRVGSPDEQRNWVMAASPDGCIERQAGGAFQACAQPELLNTRLRVANPIWEWTQLAGSPVEGAYMDWKGNPFADPVVLKDGRFPHDTIMDVSVCTGKTYELWQDGRLMEHRDAANRAVFDLASHSAIYPAPSALQNLECVLTEVPLPGKRLPAGLYAQDATSGIWQLTTDGWQAVADVQMADEVRLRIKSPALLDAGRLRARRDDKGSIFFEHRNLEDGWQEVPWELEPGALNRWRLAIDQWHTFGFYDQWLWAATSVGLVTFDVRPDGRAVLDLDRARIIREPLLDGRACTAQDLEIAPDGNALLRCEAFAVSGPEPVFQGSLAVSSDRHIFTPLPAPDPFTTRTMIPSSSGKFWEWRLDGRRGGAPGYMVVNLIPAGEQPAEPVQIAGGRFTFDALTSIASFFDDGRLEVVGGAGWFSVPPGDFYLAGWMRRTEWPDVSPVQVNLARITQVDDEEFLCLGVLGSAANLVPTGSSYLRLAKDGSIDPAESCPQIAGYDGLWQYESDQAKLSIFARNSRGAESDRRMVDGRFNDDRLIGPPATGRDAAGLYYLFPTQAGVVKLDKTLRAQRLDASPFDGLMDKSPGAVQIIGSQEVYAGSNGLYSLDGLRTPLTLTYQLPPGTTILGLDIGAYDSLSLRWQAGSERGWTLFNQSPNVGSAEHALSVYVGDYVKYLENQADWGQNPPWLALQYTNGQIDVLAAPHRTFNYQITNPFNLVTSILWQDQLFIIGEQELYQMNMSKTVLELLGK